MNHKYVILFSIFLNLFFVKFSIANDDNSANESIGCETELLNIITPGLIDQTNKIQALQKALQETTDQAQKDQIQKQLAEAENRAMVATLLIPFSNEQLVKFYSSQPNLFAGIEHYFQAPIDKLKGVPTNPYIQEKLVAMDLLSQDKMEATDLSDLYSDSVLLGLIALNLIVRESLGDIDLTQEQKFFYATAQLQYAQRLQKQAVQTINSMQVGEQVTGEEAFNLLADIFDTRQLILEPQHYLQVFMPSNKSIQFNYSIDIHQKKFNKAMKEATSLADLNEMMQTKKILISRSQDNSQIEQIVLIRLKSGFVLNMSLLQPQHNTIYKYSVVVMIDEEGQLYSVALSEDFVSDVHQTHESFSGRIKNN